MSTSQFDSLLAACLKPAGPVVIDAPALSVADAVRLANALGTRGVVARLLDGAALEGKDDLLPALAVEFGFPSHYGANWDATIDSWSDLSWLPAKGYVTLLLHADKFQAADTPAHAGFVAVCNDVAERWRGHDATLSFKLVRGVDAPAKKRGK